MLVEIQGVNSINKGAELMLYAVLQRFDAYYKNSTIGANLRCGNFQQRSEAGLQHIAWVDVARAPIIGPVVDIITNFIPQKMLSSMHIIKDSEIGAVLDASGFAYSDQRGIYPAINMAKWTKRWKAQGKKIVLMPQAFGPFENKVIKDAVIQILDNSHLIFARDRISYDYLMELNSHSEHIKLAPDFTNLVVGQIPPYWDIDSNQFCIIPNYRMIDKTSDEVKASYLPFLESSIKYLIERGKNPFILIHETNQDYQLAEVLQKRVQKDIKIVQETNPLYVKGIIGNCSGVISSRFHGLVNSLSQGVPCLATGWSHKYQMLLEDYQCPDCVVSTLSTNDEITTKISMIIDEPTRTRIVDRLKISGSHLKSVTNAMWVDIEKVIGL